MSLATDIYFELTQAKLAPDVPFAAAPDEWRAALLRGVGDNDDLPEQLTSVHLELAGLREYLSSAQAEAREAKADRDAWKKKYEEATKASQP